MARTNQRKKVYIFQCSKIPGVNDQVSFSAWLKKMPEISILADIEPVFVFGGEAASVTPAVWQKLARAIHKVQKPGVGVVVLHATDGLLYTSSALSLMLTPPAGPVVCTGGQQLVLENNSFGLKSNLINAVQVATYEFAEVCLMFGNRLLRANVAHEVANESLNIFNAEKTGVIGRIDFSIRLHEKLLLRSKTKPKLIEQLDTNVGIVYIDPTLSAQRIASQLQDASAVVVHAGEYQSLPEALEHYVQASSKDVPIVLWSKYLALGTFSPKHVSIVSHMNWHTTVVKTMWANAQASSVKQFYDILHKNNAGEIIE